MDCITAIAELFINQKFTRFQTKTMVMIKKSVEPFTVQQMLKDLKKAHLVCYDRVF